MNNMTNQGGPEQGDKSKPASWPPGEEPNPERREPEPSEQPGRPTPSGVPNEGRESVRQYLGEGLHEYGPVRLRSGWHRDFGRTSGG